MKLCGLLTLMAMSGLYIPADDESKISVFSNVLCDIGDEQSIEQNLSTFSSHIKNIINIVNTVDTKSLVLLDEIGAGTDPEEGSALALAIIQKLLELNCFGIITTHYSRLKEYAVQEGKIENASMEFDAKTLKPMYKLNIGIPGSSNAIDIARTLGLNYEILQKAESLLSDKQVSFEKVLKKAEESRRNADKLSAELEIIKAQKTDELNNIVSEKDKLTKEREKIYLNAKHETKRIVADKLAEAEEIIEELKKILKTANLESKELFRAGELRNRLKNSKYLTFEDENKPYELIPAKVVDLNIGNKVYVKSLDSYAKLYSISNNKKEAVVLIGDIKTLVKINDLYNSEPDQKGEDKVKVFRHASPKSLPLTELNVVGKTSLEAMQEVEFFIDKAIVNGLAEIKIIHGVGQGVLLKEIRNYLKTDKNVVEFRKGKYGEGENGVTIIKLK
jgi:DNA mismatch repair protein MutS2